MKSQQKMPENSLGLAVAMQLEQVLKKAKLEGFSYALYRVPLLAVHEQERQSFSSSNAWLQCDALLEGLHLVFSSRQLSAMPLAELRSASRSFVGYAFHPFAENGFDKNYNHSYQFLPAEIVVQPYAPNKPVVWQHPHCSGGVQEFSTWLQNFFSRKKKAEDSFKVNTPGGTKSESASFSQSNSTEKKVEFSLNPNEQNVQSEDCFFYQQQETTEEEEREVSSSKNRRQNITESTTQQHFASGVAKILNLIEQLDSNSIGTRSKKISKRGSKRFENIPLALAGNEFGAKNQPLVKAVLSAVKKMPRHKRASDIRHENIHEKNQQVLSAFVMALQKCPFAMVSLFSAPETGTWFTASPEMLASLSSEDGGHFFRTVSLAGTQKSNFDLVKNNFVSQTSKSKASFNAFNKNSEESESNTSSILGAKVERILEKAKWSTKEIEEQALVSRYIVEAFKKLRLRAYIEKGPRTVVAGKVLHLSSTFTVDVQKTYGQELLPDMLGLLHPTSAVAGFPKEPALQAIDELETHNRSYYAGFFGPWGIANAMQTMSGVQTQVKKQNKEKTIKENSNRKKQQNFLEADIYVNIRTAQINKSYILFYGGAGVVQGSIPEKEWQEVQLKMLTLRNFF